MNSQQLSQTMRENHAIRAAYSHYLNLNPRFLTADLVNDLAHDCAIETDEAFLILLSAALGLDTSIPPTACWSATISAQASKKRIPRSIKTMPTAAPSVSPHKNTESGKPKQKLMPLTNLSFADIPPSQRICERFPSSDILTRNSPSLPSLRVELSG